MTKKDIKILAEKSYNNKGILDKTTATKIANRLSRADLKEYIKALRAIEQKNTVTVVLPSPKAKNSDLEKEIRAKFAGKNISYEIDPELLAGIKIIDNDLIYNFNLKNTIERVINHINK